MEHENYLKHFINEIRRLKKKKKMFLYSEFEKGGRSEQNLCSSTE